MPDGSAIVCVGVLFAMAKDKKSFVLYCDQKGIWDKLDADQAGRLIKHILSYVNDESPETPDFITELAFEPIKQQLKRDLKKWEERTEGRSKAGLAGATARWQTMANDGKRIPAMAKMAVTVTDTVTVTDNVNDTVTVKESKDRSWFEKQFDEIFLDQLKIHKGKDLGRAISESWMHLSSDSLRLHNADQTTCKRLLNTWLSNMKTEQTKQTRQPTFNLSKI